MPRTQKVPVSVAGGAALPANQIVRQRIDSLSPAATFGHRGAGKNRGGLRLAENSLASFHEALSQGVDGVELDVELTADGALVVMHDDTLDRTSTGSGCVSAHTLAEIQALRLINGDGHTSGECPPTLEQVYRSLPPATLINVELKVFSEPCRTASSAPEQLACSAVELVRRLGVADRTLFSSFDLTAAATVKKADPCLYAAVLVPVPEDELIEQALALGLDAIHPYQLTSIERIDAVLDAGLQVNVWTVNSIEHIERHLDAGVSSMITDRPERLVEVVRARRG